MAHGNYHGGHGTGDTKDGQRDTPWGTCQRGQGTWRRGDGAGGGTGSGGGLRTETDTARPGQQPPPRGRGRATDTPLMLMSAESRSAGHGGRAGLNHPGGGEGGATGGEQRKAWGRGGTAAHWRHETRRKELAPLVLGGEIRRGSGEPGAAWGGQAGGRPPAARAWWRPRAGRAGAVGARHVTGGPPPFCPAEAVFRAQRPGRRALPPGRSSAPPPSFSRPAPSLPLPADRPPPRLPPSLPARALLASAILWPSAACRGPAPRRSLPPPSPPSSRVPAPSGA